MNKCSKSFFWDPERDKDVYNRRIYSTQNNLPVQRSKEKNLNHKDQKKNKTINILYTQMTIVYVENIKESMDKLLEFISWLAMFWIQSQYLKNPQLKKTDISIGQEKK